MNTDKPFIPIVRTMSDLPPGEGGLVIPHEDTFNAVYGWAYQQYGHLFDEAVQNSLPNAYAMRLDPVIMEPLETRKRAVALLPWHLEAFDVDDQNQVKAAQATERRIKMLPDLEALHFSLSDGIWYGRQGAQILYDWDVSEFDGRRGIKPTDWVPIEGDKLVFKWKGSLGIKVGPKYQGTWEPADGGGGGGMCHFFTPNERQNIIGHRYVKEDAPYWKGQMAGAVQGVGLRHRLYWFWAAKNMLTGLLADYLRWFAQGLMVLRYELGNEKHMMEMQARAMESQGKPFFLMPVAPDSGDPKYDPIQMLNPSAASTNLITDLIANYYDDVIRRMILGQGGTTMNEGGGLNDGIATLHANTFSGVVKFDALLLSASLSRDFVTVIHRWSYPGMPPPRHVFDIDTPNVGQQLEAAQFIVGAGGKINLTALKKAAGLPPIKPGDEELGGPAPMQPTSVDGMQEGLPVYEAQQEAPDDAGAAKGSTQAPLGQPVL